MKYTPVQWILFFFFYCLAGWIWESCYVSVRKKRWVNRGFLHGPWLPIYGFGAVIILWLVLPVRESLILTYLVGMIGATVLEYVTGVLMEFLFHVRYWDYSDQPFNLNGHICLGVSLAWGGFSVLMVRVIHEPVANLILRIPDTAAVILTIVLLILFAADVADSVKVALNLRKLLEKIEEGSTRLAELERKLQEAVHAAELGRRRLEESRQKSLEEGKLRLEEGKQRVEESKLRFAQEREHLAEEAALRLQEFRESVAQKQAELTSRTNRKFRQVESLLRRNPSAASAKKYVHSLRQVKDWIQARKKEESDRRK